MKKILLILLIFCIISGAYAIDGFSIDKKLIVEQLSPGQAKPELIKITNELDKEIFINITKEPELEKFVHTNLKYVKIPAYETRSLYLEFYSFENTSQRIEGNISFKRENSGLIPEVKYTKIILDVEKKKEDYVNVVGIDKYNIIKPGDNLNITFEVGRDYMGYNFSCETSYFLTNSNGDVIWKDSDIFREYSKKITVVIETPVYLSDGLYELKINVKVFDNLINTKTKTIQVKGVKHELTKYIPFILAVVAMLVVVIILELRKRKLKMEKELFLF